MSETRLAPAALYQALAAEHVGFFTGVPDSYLSPFISYLEHQAPAAHHGAVNEALAVGRAIGHHVATGTVPLVYMQNSGLNLALDPLTSLTHSGVMRVPMVLLIGWRGQPGLSDEPQHLKPGAITAQLLTAADIPHHVLTPSAAREQVTGAVAMARATGTPVALLVGRDLLEPYPPPDAPADGLPRETAIGLVADALGPADLVVTTNGKIGRELFELRERQGDGHERDLILVGGMGVASSVAAGIAAARPRRRVWCFDGDGAVLMHLGALATIGTDDAPNLYHVVFNNGAHDSTGGQATVGHRIDLPGLARACGYRRVYQAADGPSLTAALADLAAAPGPALLEVRIARGARADLGRPTVGPGDNKAAVMGFLDSDQA
jgi:phosphonopyruvate decarboxylase